MGSGNRMSNILTIVVAIALIVIVGTILYHFVDTSYETETAVQATENESLIFTGVYVRDESVLSYDGNGAISYAVPDGGKIAVGDVIAEVYSDESDIALQQEIDALEEKLETLRRISNVGTVEEAQPETMARQFTSYYETLVQSKDEKNLVAMQTAEENFLESYSTYQILISDGDISFDEQIASVAGEIASLQSQKNPAVSQITSDTSAYFLSQVDGYESTLSVEKLDEITPETIESVIDNDNINKTDSNENILGKTIADYRWYMIGMIDNSEQKYAVGDTVTLQILTSGATTSAEIVELRSYTDTDQVMVVLSSETLTSDFVRNRYERVEMIEGEYEGIRVPRDAIRFADVEETTVDEETGEEITQTVNCRGVYVEDGEEIIFRRLDVIYEGDDYVLSRLNAGDGYLLLYDSIIVEGIDANGN